MAAPPTEHEILDVNRRYHDVAAETYDSKWGISFGEIGHQQVLGQDHEAARPAARPVRALARDRRRHGLLQPQPAADRRDRAGDLHGHQPRHARHARAQRARARPRRRDRGLRRRRAAVRGRDLRPRARPRRPAPPARPRPLLRASSCACSSPAGRCSSPASRRRRATSSPPYPKRAAVKAAPLWRKAIKARPAPHAPRRRRGRARARGRRRRPRVRPGRPRSTPRAGAGFDRRRRSAARSCWRTGSAGSTARWRPAPSPRTSRGAGSSTPTSGYILLQRVDRSAAGAAPAAADLLQPDARGPQARRDASPQSTRPARSTCCATSARWSTRRLGADRVRDRLRDHQGGQHRGGGRGRHRRSCCSIERLVRRKPVVNAIGGLFGDRRWRRSSPSAAARPRASSCRKVLIQLGLGGRVFAGSAVIRRPLTGLHHRRSSTAPTRSWRKLPGGPARDERATRWPGRRCSLLRAVVYARADR